MMIAVKTLAVSSEMRSETIFSLYLTLALFYYYKIAYYAKYAILSALDFIKSKLKTLLKIFLFLFHSAPSLEVSWLLPLALVTKLTILDYFGY